DPMLTRMLAENFDALWVLIFGAPLVLLAIAGLSFIGSARGHWSGPVLAAPAIGLGALLTLSIAMGRGPCAIVVLSLLPAVVGILAIGLWSERRGTRGGD